jgi:hypothetical protein
MAITEVYKRSPAEVTITTGDIEIGAVELKDATTDTRAKIKSDGTDNAVVFQNNAKHLGSGGQVIAIGAAAVRSAQLALGRWRISGSGDIWFRQGDNAVVATKAGAGSAYLAAGAIEECLVETAASEGYISIIQDGAETGNVSLTRLS